MYILLSLIHTFKTIFQSILDVLLSMLFGKSLIILKSLFNMRLCSNKLILLFYS